MLSQRFAVCLCFALTAIVGRAVPARAERPSRAGNQAEGNEASIVLVGAAAGDLELKALLVELLEQRGVHARISEQAAFGHEELLRAEHRGGGVLVFVVPGLGGNVGLYFRAPDGQRFLLRSVLLRAGFDDVGRELVGQVVETAVRSLLDSGDGLTREQARAALSNEEAAKPPPEPDELTPSTEQPAPRRAQHRSSPPQIPRIAATLEGWLALRYGAVALGAELGFAHGPGLEAGVGFRRGYLLRGRASWERDFPQTFGTSAIAAELRRTRLRLAADVGLELTPRQLLLVTLGIGQDRSGVKPVAVPGSFVAPQPAFDGKSPVALAELRYEAVFGRFRLAAALGADVSLVRTHYDVLHPLKRESVGEPWLVRPSAALALAFCPRLARF